MLKFQAVAEKTAKNFRGYFFAALCTPCTCPSENGATYIFLQFRKTLVDFDDF